MNRRAIVILSAIALLVCYASTLRGMVDQWTTDEDMGHGFLVPVVILWIVWRERRRYGALHLEPSWWGLGLLAVGAGMQCFSVLGAGLFAGSVGLLFSVAGVVVFLGGFRLLESSLFLFLLALFMLPKLAIVYNQAILPLQLLASRMAASMLTVAGVGVIREGAILDVGGHRVAVVDACNGIRYLLPLGFMALVFGYLSDPKPWMRAALLVAAVPIAIVANAVRVAASAYVPALDGGFLHSLSGWLIFVVCLAALMFARYLFNSVGARHA